MYAFDVDPIGHIVANFLKVSGVMVETEQHRARSSDITMYMPDILIGSSVSTKEAVS
ncbi:hypothetical protein N878_00610 [Pseudomonas sp. EGD-AK9]|nr:hypothetical protein N878_00610 [Pseudomonas sp. EGD-AK9]